MTDSFWTGGQSAYTKGIKKEHKKKLAKLKVALSACEDLQSKRKIEQEILAEKNQLKEKLDGRDSLIF